jgi:hypothetical protein
MSMKSDKANPRSHTVIPAHKTNHPSVLGESGTNEHPAKSHAEDVALGEGLEYNEVQKAHNKASVREAKSVSGLTEASRNHQVRRENGGADPEGDCDC